MLEHREVTRVADQLDRSNVVARINSAIALWVTRCVGSMWCAYLFTVIALLGLPAALAPSGEGIVAWIAQTFLQLVLLSVIMVGQSVQAKAADQRSVDTYTDTEEILRRLDALHIGQQEIKQLK
jgi:hypothetical protein